MAINQKSRLQQRRGLLVDLPTLKDGEIGQVIDERRLFIGNGQVEDGAPEVGNTEILTEFSDSAAKIKHTYKSNTNIEATTGPDGNNPVVRTLQQVLDDRLSIKDYGALGNNDQDDTDNINRLMRDIYTVETNPPEQGYRSVYAPAGVYLLSDFMLLPPNSEIVGDGIGKTIFLMTDVDKEAVIRTADSNFNTDLQLGDSGATLPINITLRNLTIQHSGDWNGVNLDRASGILFERVGISGGYTGSGPSINDSNAVYLDPIGTSYEHRNIRFKNCIFSNFGSVSNLTADGIDAIGVYFEECEFINFYKGIDASPIDFSDFISDVKVTNSVFRDIQKTCIYAGIQTEKIISNSNSFFNCGDTDAPVIVFTEGTTESGSTEDVFEVDVGVVPIQNDSKSCLVLNPQTNFIFRNVTITSKRPRFTLQAGHTNSLTNISFDITKTDSIFIDYTLKRRNFTRIGRLFAATDGTIRGTAFSDLFTESGPTGAVFNYNISGSTFRITYTTDSVVALGTVANPSVTTNDTLVINGNLVVLSGGSLGTVISDINLTAIPNLTASADPDPITGLPILVLTLVSGPTINISGTGTALADLGLDTDYFPTIAEFHIQTKSWLMDDSVTQTSFWIDSDGDSMTTSDGDDLVFGQL